LLSRQRIRLPSEHRQLLLVHAPLWESSGGILSRWTRAPGEQQWKPQGDPLPVRLGSAGLGWGRGLFQGGPPGSLSGPTKQEGDGRSPAGAFALGTAFSQGRPREWQGTRWPWRAVSPLDRFVDDPASPHYNTWQRAPRTGKVAWASAERLSQYELGVVVHHNTEPVQPGAGSAIFLHVWQSPDTPTIGCTAMARESLLDLVSWLDPEANPVLVQVPGTVF
jgi:hypothetical protein